MLDPKYRVAVFAFFMAIFMSGFMSLVITLFNVGWVDEIASVWLKAWLFAFCIAFPTVMVVAPWVHRLTNKLIRA
ncbi:DUF2798 domain-containing protein [Pseudoalteromonas sp.]|jgi:hypothetical protein|uniref:DUF2798 domain-containing protein n=1 Tax=Pseudoalteromonas sp. TaxID=53249 RepID=UPI003565C101